MYFLVLKNDEKFLINFKDIYATVNSIYIVYINYLFYSHEKFAMMIDTVLHRYKRIYELHVYMFVYVVVNSFNE